MLHKIESDLKLISYDAIPVREFETQTENKIHGNTSSWKYLHDLVYRMHGTKRVLVTQYVYWKCTQIYIVLYRATSFYHIYLTLSTYSRVPL